METVLGLANQSVVDFVRNPYGSCFSISQEVSMKWRFATQDWEFEYDELTDEVIDLIYDPDPDAEIVPIEDDEDDLWPDGQTAPHYGHI